MTKLDDRYTTLTAQLQSQYRNSNVADLIEGILEIKKRFVLEAHNTLLSDCIDLSTAKGDALDLWGFLLGVSRWYPLETTPEMRYNLWNFNYKKFYELNFWCPLNGHFEYLSDNEYRDVLLYLLRKQNIYPNLKISNELVKAHFDKYGADLKVVDSREMEMILEYDHDIMPHKLCYFLMLKDIIHRPAGVGIKVEDKPAPPPPPSERKSYAINIDDNSDVNWYYWNHHVVFDEKDLAEIINELGATIDPDFLEVKEFSGINAFTKEPFTLTQNERRIITDNDHGRLTLRFLEWSEEGYQLFGIPDTETGDLENIGEAENHDYYWTGWLDQGRGTTREVEGFSGYFGGYDGRLDIFLMGGYLGIALGRYTASPTVPLNTLAYRIQTYGPTYISHAFVYQTDKALPTRIIWADYNTEYIDGHDVRCGGFVVLEPSLSMRLGNDYCFLDNLWFYMDRLPLNMAVNGAYSEPRFYSFWDFQVNKHRFDNCLYTPNKYDLKFKTLEYTQTDKRFKRS